MFGNRPRGVCFGDLKIILLLLCVKTMRHTKISNLGDDAEMLPLQSDLISY